MWLCCPRRSHDGGLRVPWLLLIALGIAAIVLLLQNDQVQAALASVSP